MKMGSHRPIRHSTRRLSSTTSLSPSLPAACWGAGRTGSGKTTLTRLFFRLYDADAGGIRIGHDDGVDLRGVPLGELRRHIGLADAGRATFSPRPCATI